MGGPWWWEELEYEARIALRVNVFYTLAVRSLIWDPTKV